jgi:hypothetical protein
MRRLLIGLSVLLLGLGGASAIAGVTTARFGASLTDKTQPSNAGKGDFCNAKRGHPDCSYVLMQAYQCEFGKCTNGHLAPADGTIGTISLIACYPGSFTLQIASVNQQSNQVQAIRSGPVIDYQGDPHHCNGSKFPIESFTVSVPVEKGDYLAVDAESIDFVRCSGGSANMLLFDPPLADGAAARTADGQDGCFMLLEATYAP